MCGRYVSALPPAELARSFGAIGELPNVEASWNVTPTDRRPVIRRHPESGERRLDLLTWGLVPHFTEDLKAARKPINARAGTVSSAGMVRGARARRRCIVPADLFYEWKIQPDGKKPLAIGRQDGLDGRGRGRGGHPAAAGACRHAAHVAGLARRQQRSETDPR